jgi:hypothetical protein
MQLFTFRWMRMTPNIMAQALIILATLLAACHTSSEESSANEYRKMLSLGQITAFYYTEPQTRLRYPLVRGTLSNLGTRKLEVVELSLHFKNNLGKTIFEDHGYPIYVSGFSSDPILRQILLPGQRVPFAIKSIQCPSSWQEGEVEVLVSKVVFAKPH